MLQRASNSLYSLYNCVLYPINKLQYYFDQIFVPLDKFNVRNYVSKSIHDRFVNYFQSLLIGSPKGKRADPQFRFRHSTPSIKSWKEYAVPRYKTRWKAQKFFHLAILHYMIANFNCYALPLHSALSNFNYYNYFYTQASVAIFPLCTSYLKSFYFLLTQNSYINESVISFAMNVFTTFNVQNFLYITAAFLTLNLIAEFVSTLYNQHFCFVIEGSQTFFPNEIGNLEDSDTVEKTVPLNCSIIQNIYTHFFHVDTKRNLFNLFQSALLGAGLHAASHYGYVNMPFPYAKILLPMVLFCWNDTRIYDNGFATHRTLQTFQACCSTAIKTVENHAEALVMTPYMFVLNMIRHISVIFCDAKKIHSDAEKAMGDLYGDLKFQEKNKQLLNGTANFSKSANLKIYLDNLSKLEQDDRPVYYADAKRFYNAWNFRKSHPVCALTFESVANIIDIVLWDGWANGNMVNIKYCNTGGNNKPAWVLMKGDQNYMSGSVLLFKNPPSSKKIYCDLFGPECSVTR